MGGRPRHMKKRPLKPGVLTPLRSADFRRLWIAQTISIVGDKINQIGLSIMVYQVTGSFVQMGIVFGLTFLPAALFGLIAGPLVDRWDRRRAMIVADALRAFVVAGMALAAASGLDSAQKIVIVYALAFVSATASLFFEPARMALVPSILGEHELMAANALDMTTMSVSELLGIAFGGALVTTIGYAPAFWFDAGTFVISAAFVLLVRHRAPAPSRRRLHLGVVWDDLRSGLARIRGDGVLRGVTITYGALALCGGAAITLTVLLALDVYRASGLTDALRLTVADLATTAGLLIGSVCVGMSGSGNAGRKYLWGIVGFGVFMLQFLWVPNLWIAAAVFVLAGVANQYFIVPMISMLQSHTEPDTRGRVFAVRLTIARVATVIGLTGAGVAAHAYGVREMAAALGVLVLAVGALGFSMPRLRNA